MRAARDFDAPRVYEMDDESAQAIGWVTFAAILLAFGGIWNCIAGIAAISSAHVYTANANFVFSNLNTWGWIVLILAIVQIIAALALFAGSEFARWFGIVVAGLNAIGQLMFVPAYPWWAIAMFTLDILIIYGLAAYGGTRLRGM